MSNDLWKLTASEIAGRVRNRDVSAREVADACLERTAATDDELKAFIRVEAEWARDVADGIDKRVAAGEDPGPLCGVPVAIKDVLCTEGRVTTCGSQMLADFHPPYTATSVQRLLAAGAVPVGKTNMDEFAMGSSTENSGFFPTRNPWDSSRVPGGSSGGSAVAVAAGQTPLALGTDTGGSVRQPASFCGVVGLKPTYGAVSRYGLIAFGSSLDQVGIFARTADDAAAVLQAISGNDPCDATSAKRDPVAAPVARDDWSGVRVGLPREYFAMGLSPDVEARTRQAAEAIRSMGAEVVEVSLQHADLYIPVYYLIATAEASSNLARYDGAHYGHRTTQDVRGGAHSPIIELFSKSRGEAFGAEVKRRIMLGTYGLSAGYKDAYYVKALKVRGLVRQDFVRAMQDVDFLAAPTSPTTAFPLGERTADPLQMYLSDVCTLGVSLAGLPAVSVPCGLDSDGLPVGLQLIGRHFDDANLLALAGAYERTSQSAARCW